MNKKRIFRLGVLTGGGDCPGLNAAIRAITKSALNDYGWKVFGIEDGFEGLVEGRMRELRNTDVSGIINLGGTILGTSSKGDPWHYPVETVRGRTRIADVSGRGLRHFRSGKLDGLIAIGGDGTMNIALKFAKLGLPVVGVPKTIDNDLAATDITFGHDTAVSIAAEAIDRLHTTASSHHRVMVIEVMGRYAGWIALTAGLAGGADIILIPEIPFRWKPVLRKVRERNTLGKRFSIVCVAEGVSCPGVGVFVKGYDQKRTDPKQLGGVGAYVARKIALGVRVETRVTVLGHLQRGGGPTAFDRNLATRFGVAATKTVHDGKFGTMVALQGREIFPVPLENAVARLKLVPPDHPLVLTARSVGTSFGDEG